MTASLDIGEAFSTACKQTRVDVGVLGIATAEHAATEYFRYAAPASPGLAANAELPVLCATKLLTGTLIHQLCARAMLSLEDRLVDHLRVRTPCIAVPGQLAEVTVAQLLSHTHGLGGGLALDCAPVATSGFIDAEQVFAAISAERPLFPGGRFYSYSSCGYMLLGVLIEWLHNKPFAQVLRDELFGHLADSAASGCAKQASSGASTDASNKAANGAATGAAKRVGLDSGSACPSSGNRLQLSAEALLSFLKRFVGEGARNAFPNPSLFTRILDSRIALPGWSPQIMGSCMGWRYFGSGWYGHNGVGPHALCYLRLNALTKTAICLQASAANCNLSLLPSLTLQSRFPELAFNPQSQPAIRTEFSPGAYADVLGTYGTRHRTFRVYAEQRLNIEISWHTGSAAGRHVSLLYPADRAVFYLAKPWQRVAFVQVVTDPEDNSMHLWDHDQIWPKLPAR